MISATRSVSGAGTGLALVAMIAGASLAALLPNSAATWCLLMLPFALALLTGVAKSGTA